MSCLARIGCVVLLVALGVAAFLTRDRWLNRGPASAAVDSEWTPLSEAGAKRTGDALATLSSASGPVFVSASAADVASYVFLQLTKSLPASSDSFAARVHDDKLSLRASMNTKELGSSVLGVLGSLLGDREQVEMSGQLHVIGKGIAEFTVTDVRIRGVALPKSVITRLVTPLVKGKRAPGLDANALPLSIPSYVGDVRVENGKITLYKNVQ